MSLSKVDLRYRPQDLKLSVVLDDYRRAINNIVDEVNGLSEDSADTIVASSDVMNSLNPDYFIRSGKIYIKNYYDTTYPISGGGTLSSPRTLSLLYFDTDLGLDADNKLYVKDAGIDHDATTNFVVDEHIAHTGVSITAGTGLTGGGDISSTRTIGLSHLGIESLTDPGADKLMFWDDSASATKWATLGTGLAFTDVQLNVSLALNDLSDVSISLPGDSALLMYATTSGLWTAASVYAWKTIIVAGQDNVVADELADDLTLVAGANVTLTTSAAGDSVTIASAAGASAHDILSATHSDALAAAVVRGSIIYGNATPKWATLVIGAANRVLGCDGTDAAWVQADHGAALTGLGDDDHTQYLLADGTRALAGNWALGGFNLTGGGSIYSDYYILGTNPASSGRIRIPNNAIIGARNAANDANISLIYADTNNRTLIADGTFSFTSSGNAVIGASSAGSEKLDIRGRIALQETTAPSLTAGYGKVWTSSSDSLLYFMDDSGNTYDLTAGGGAGPSPKYYQGGTTRRYFTFSGTAVGFKSNLATHTSVGVAANAVDTTTNWRYYTITNTSFSGVRSDDLYVCGNWNAEVWIRIKTDSDITSQRLFYGFYSGSASNADDIYNDEYAGVLFSTNIGANWLVATEDAAGTATTSSTGLAVIASTIYDIHITWDGTTVTTEITPLGGSTTTTTKTTNVPNAASLLGVAAQGWGIAVTRYHNIAYIYCEYD